MQRTYVDECRKLCTRLNEAARVVNHKIGSPDFQVPLFDCENHGKIAEKCDIQSVLRAQWHGLDSAKRGRIMAVLACLCHSCEFLLESDSHKLIEDDIDAPHDAIFVKASAILEILGIRTEPVFTKFINEILSSSSLESESRNIGESLDTPRLSACVSSAVRKFGVGAFCEPKSDETRAASLVAQQSAHYAFLDRLQAFLAECEASKFEQIKADLMLKEKTVRSCLELGRECELLEEKNGELAHLLKNYIRSKISQELIVPPLKNKAQPFEMCNNSQGSK